MAKANGKHSNGNGKTSAETAVVLVAQPHGGALQIGNPGNKGGGRTPDEFKAMCQKLATRTKTVAAVLKILRNPDHTHYMSALKWATENGYGKAPQPVEVSGELEHLHGVIEVPPKLSPEQWRQRYKQTA